MAVRRCLGSPVDPTLRRTLRFLRFFGPSFISLFLLVLAIVVVVGRHGKIPFHLLIHWYYFPVAGPVIALFFLHLVIRPSVRWRLSDTIGPSSNSRGLFLVLDYFVTLLAVHLFGLFLFSTHVSSVERARPVVHLFDTGPKTSSGRSFLDTTGLFCCLASYRRLNYREVHSFLWIVSVDTLGPSPVFGTGASLLIKHLRR